jgi:hypothetical protein
MTIHMRTHAKKSPLASHAGVTPLSRCDAGSRMEAMRNNGFSEGLRGLWQCGLIQGGTEL